MNRYQKVIKYTKPLVEIDEKIRHLNERMTTTGLYTVTNQDGGLDEIPPEYNPPSLGNLGPDNFQWPDQGDGSDPDNLLNLDGLVVTDTLGREVSLYDYLPGITYSGWNRQPDYSIYPNGKPPLAILYDGRALASTRYFVLNEDGLNFVIQKGAYTTPGPYTDLQKEISNWIENGDKSNLTTKTVYIWGGLQVLLGQYYGASQYYPSDRDTESDPVADRGLYAYTMYVPSTANTNYASDPGVRSRAPRVNRVISRDDLGDPTYYPGPVNISPEALNYLLSQIGPRGFDRKPGTYHKNLIIPLDTPGSKWRPGEGMPLTDPLKNIPFTGPGLSKGKGNTMVAHHEPQGRLIKEKKKEIEEGMNTSGMGMINLGPGGDIDLESINSSVSPSGSTDGYSQSGSTYTFGPQSGEVNGSSLTMTIDAKKYDTLKFDFTAGTIDTLEVTTTSGDYILSATSGTKTITLRDSDKRSGLTVAFYVQRGDGKQSVGTNVIRNLAFQRRTPLNVLVPLDDPEANSFIRGGLGGDKERKAKLKDMLEAGNEYLSKYTNITPSQTTPGDIELAQLSPQTEKNIDAMLLKGLERGDYGSGPQIQKQIDSLKRNMRQGTPGGIPRV